jgi:hypothetical protein
LAGRPAGGGACRRRCRTGGCGQGGGVVTLAMLLLVRCNCCGGYPRTAFLHSTGVCTVSLGTCMLGCGLKLALKQNQLLDVGSCSIGISASIGLTKGAASNYKYSGSYCKHISGPTEGTCLAKEDDLIVERVPGARRRKSSDTSRDLTVRHARTPSFMHLRPETYHHLPSLCCAISSS